jgi:hypothetical protein
MLSFDNAECNGEPKAGTPGRAISGRLAPLECPEDRFSLRRGNARPFIVNDDLHRVVRLAGGDMGDMAVSQSITNDVGEGTRERGPITTNEKGPPLTRVECNLAASHSSSLDLLSNK